MAEYVPDENKVDPWDDMPFDQRLDLIGRLFDRIAVQFSTYSASSKEIVYAHAPWMLARLRELVAEREKAQHKADAFAAECVDEAVAKIRAQFTWGMVDAIRWASQETRSAADAAIACAAADRIAALLPPRPEIP